MKLTSSPSSPPSKPSIFGCLSFVLRRILHPRTLSPPPFDQFQNPKSTPPTTPSSPANLMVSDSSPESNSRNNSPPISRTKSANYTNRTPEDPPPYFEIEDGEFFVLRFENGMRNGKSRVEKAKSDRRRRRVRFKERPGFRVSESDESENLSPVSVLDSSLFNGDHEEPPSSEEEAKSRSSSPRRKLVSELSNLGHLTSDHSNESCSIADHDQDPNEEIEVSQCGSKRKDYHSHRNVEMLNQIHRLAGSELSDSEWECKNKGTRNLRKSEIEIGDELGLQIVDQLVYEFVHQLL